VIKPARASWHASIGTLISGPNRYSRGFTGSHQGMLHFATWPPSRSEKSRASTASESLDYFKATINLLGISHT
jgi:hypothetical protein